MFDNVSETCDDAYIKKVYDLVRDVDGCWSDLTVSEQAEKMFHRRFRANWEAPDTVYDEWVILRGWERPWFDNHRFNVLFPDTLEEMKTPNPAKRKRRRLSIDELAGDTASGSGNDSPDTCSQMPQVESTPVKSRFPKKDSLSDESVGDISFTDDTSNKAGDSEEEEDEEEENEEEQDEEEVEEEENEGEQEEEEKEGEQKEEGKQEEEGEEKEKAGEE